MWVFPVVDGGTNRTPRTTEVSPTRLTAQSNLASPRQICQDQGLHEERVPIRLTQASLSLTRFLIQFSQVLLSLWAQWCSSNGAARSTLPRCSRNATSASTLSISSPTMALIRSTTPGCLFVIYTKSTLRRSVHSNLSTRRPRATAKATSQKARRLQSHRRGARHARGRKRSPRLLPPVLVAPNATTLQLPNAPQLLTWKASRRAWNSYPDLQCLPNTTVA
mmetsp:Transcript_12370/g.26878  ORF Transcript_12370/g.26878 Transcript_12370/m.26878 type:complete len:221 (+) Transcript_12370:1748-2410(+)